MIAVRPDDLPEVDSFLAARAHLAMFPLSNLRKYGLEGGHPNAVTLWLSRWDGAITDVLAHSESGMVMPVLPSQDYGPAALALRGRAVSGVIGVRAWVRGLTSAAGLTGPRTLDRDEPQFLLSLDALQVPLGDGDLVPLALAPADVMKAWIHAYMIEALNTPPAQADVEVHDRYRRYVEADSHVCLMAGDRPLAMSGFNARLPDIVQIGGVYTPPALRGKGHARRCVALHLGAAQAAGVRRATLFSANLAASRAYQAVGFRQNGDWTLLLLRDKETVHG